MQGQLCTEPIEVIFDPGALVMNLTQIVVENDCIWGQSDYPRSQMNDSFWVKKMTIVRVKTRKWPQHRVVNDYIEGSELENDPKM